MKNHILPRSAFEKWYFWSRIPELAYAPTKIGCAVSGVQEGNHAAETGSNTETIKQNTHDLRIKVC
jgi:hypothetical protein